jgi:N-acetyltransferase 10
MARAELLSYMTPFDRKRIEAYVNGFCEQHVITDLLPTMARHVFLDKLEIELNSAQAAILLSRGLQHKEISEIEREISLHSSQILALLHKCIKKISDAYSTIEKSSIGKELFQVVSSNSEKMDNLRPFFHQNGENLVENTQKQDHCRSTREQRQNPLKSIDLSRYAIGGNEGEWDQALKSQRDISSISILNGRKSKHKHISTSGEKPSSKFKKLRY